MVFDYFSWHPNSLCDSCSRTEDEYEVFIVLVLAEDINCHPGQSGKVPLYWQFPPEPHIYISGKSGSSCWWWGSWASHIYFWKIRLQLLMMRRLSLIYVFRGNQALVYGDDEAEHLVIYIWGKSGSCDCKLSLCTKKLSNGWTGYVFLVPKIRRTLKKIILSIFKEKYGSLTHRWRGRDFSFIIILFSQSLN